ncbi:unnamed protein product [Caenorhabditis sp. 36 PRJEB53466]|nr:unnamed protein product [Caenorhabditis sp. 36 PRJEB53466]
MMILRNRKISNTSPFVVFALSTFFIFSCIVVLLSFLSHLENQRSTDKRVRVKSAKGYVTLVELNEQVYKKYGYEIVRSVLPIPKVRMIEEPSCENVFRGWSRVAKQPQPNEPPKRIPEHVRRDFLLNGYTFVQYVYSNDKNSPNGQRPTRWDELSEIINYGPRKVADMGYGNDGMSVHHAMNEYRLDGMRGLVVGSMIPWVEIFALQHGAKHVLTVEYNQLNIQHEFNDRIASIHPNELVNEWRKYADSFDFAVSFSSIEHSGIGRYGDPVDPIGDFREMLKIKCLLKPGGLLFFGVPLDQKMLSLRSLIILFGLLAVALACAPHMPQRQVQHGYCKFYVDGTSDTTTSSSSRKKRDSSSSDSSGSGESDSGSGGTTKYNRSKKKKNTKCYEYEDGTKDEGATLKEGVTYTVTVTKTSS